MEAAAARRTGARTALVDSRPVSGGCISPAASIRFDDGSEAFLKWSDAVDAPSGLFRAEAEAIATLASTRTVRVPVVFDVADSWLLLEWIQPGPPDPHAWRDLGRDLARLHRSGSGDIAFGWHADNHIGSLPQRNGFDRDWAKFWAERRIEPQFRRARRAGHFDTAVERRFDALLSKLDALLGPAARADGPSPLHGDLWRGNVHFAADGHAILIDPSTYYGHREVDLAMADLFGGFDRAFHEGYEKEWPMQPGYAPGRRAAYQLYYLLVHVNLFGAGYAAGSRAAIDAALRASGLD